MKLGSFMGKLICNGSCSESMANGPMVRVGVSEHGLAKVVSGNPEPWISGQVTTGQDTCQWMSVINGSLL